MVKGGAGEGPQKQSVQAAGGAGGESKKGVRRRNRQEQTKGLQFGSVWGPLRAVFRVDFRLACRSVFGAGV